MEKVLEHPRSETDGGVVLDDGTHAPLTTAESASTCDETSTVASMGEDNGSSPGDGSTTETTSHTETITELATETSSETSHSVLLDKVTWLLQAQTEAMTAQAQTTAVQHLLAVHCYTGEDDQTDKELFDKWLEGFEERHGATVNRSCIT